MRRVGGELEGLSEPALVLTPPAQASEQDDGLLTASRVAQLQLDADWVVLSACNTAAGDGTPGAEGLSGLAKAFFYAGTRAVLVSHWPVFSKAAVKLTTTTFEALAKEPRLGRAGALQKAMLSMADSDTEPVLGHPMLWAPFVVVGEGWTRHGEQCVCDLSRRLHGERKDFSRWTARPLNHGRENWSRPCHIRGMEFRPVTNPPLRQKIERLRQQLISLLWPRPKASRWRRREAAHITAFLEPADPQSRGRDWCHTADAPRTRHRTDAGG